MKRQIKLKQYLVRTPFVFKTASILLVTLMHSFFSETRQACCSKYLKELTKMFLWMSAASSIHRHLTLRPMLCGGHTVTLLTRWGWTSLCHRLLANKTWGSYNSSARFELNFTIYSVTGINLSKSFFFISLVPRMPRLTSMA